MRPPRRSRAAVGPTTWLAAGGRTGSRRWWLAPPRTGFGAAPKRCSVSVWSAPFPVVGRGREARGAALVACRAADGLRSCAKRLQGLVSLASVPWWGDRLSVTVSMGGTMVRPGAPVESLLKRAEEALQAATAAHADAVLVI